MNRVSDRLHTVLSVLLLLLILFPAAGQELSLDATVPGLMDSVSAISS